MLPGRTKIIRLLLANVVMILAATLLGGAKAYATEEPYMNELKGAQVAAGNYFTVADEKFSNATSWGLISQNIAVNNIISFEINFDTTIYFYDKPFDCTVNFKIYIYGNQSDTSQITDSTTHSNISLQVHYDTITGKPYKGIALYKFAGSYKYKVKILSITSPQLSPLPAIFRLKGQIIVDRQYTFNDNSTDVTQYSIVNGNQLQLQWTPSNYPGAEQFDLEYTHIDGASATAASIRSYAGSTGYTVPTDSLNKWFANNNTRITTAASAYLLNIPYDSGFILFRLRGVQMHYPDGLRWEGNWNYLARPAAVSCSGSSCATGVVFFDAHESNLNWQYEVTIAEDGKRQEKVSYFDGTLHNRQTITINTSDNKNVVQETIYDALGRPAVNILPAPTNDSTLHYFRNFNRNKTGNPYSYSDLLYGADCTTAVDSITNVSGAGQYYSGNNPFLNTYYYAKYIPAADGYPLIATEYLADNTGKVKAVGDVGPTFQLNSGHETKYFYGKPSQTELDRLFGSEAGNASHYLKNMVVDPNGQISVSYKDATGVTVATALAGATPPNLHALPSSVGASTQVTNDLMNPEDFSRRPEDRSVAASATFLAPVTGTYILNYRVDPLRMEKLYGPNKDSVICNNCYYNLLITVKDNCNNLIRSETRSAGAVFDTACANPPGVVQGTVNVDISAIGEYYVTYKLVVSGDALDFYDSVHLEKNSDIKKLNYFLLEELKNTDFYGCYSQCETCLDALGTKEEFTQRFKVFYTTDSLAFTPDDSSFVLSLYDSLYMHCVSIQSECATNICDEKLALLKMDVTPGGQYALYDSSSLALLEPNVNVLKRRNEISFFTDAYGNRDSVQLYNVNGEDSIKVDVNDLSDSMFIVNWQERWADSLVKLHPEYCHYLWCIANSNSYEFDNEISLWQDADTAMARGWFNPNSYDAILAQDPFFLPGGRGYDLRSRMSDSLRLFSRTYARMSKPDRNMLQFIDIVLYCNNQYNGWESCNPDSACRSRNREWFLYQQLYLNLKQKFYEEARLTSPDPVFYNCVNCHIGKDPVQLAGAVCTPPSVSDFTIIDSLGKKFVIYADTVNGVSHDYLVMVFSYEWPNYVEHYDTLKFNKGDWYKSLTYLPSQQSFEVYETSCFDNYTPFTDSTTCNASCPGGVYDPYDKNNISLYVEYGNPAVAPTGTPEGYGNCRFYANFLLQTGPHSSCQFYNVWVCMYDSTCGGICGDVAVYPSTCRDNSGGGGGNPSIASKLAADNGGSYANKIRRYPEYVNTDDFIAQTLSTNPRQNSAGYTQQVIDECQSNCEAQADVWIKQLKGCTTDESKLAQLKQALIDVCKAGCSADRLYGASTLPATTPAAYHSFEEAIVAILGPGAINDSCTAELLSNPYPYDKQPAYTRTTIMQSTYEICQKIGQYKKAWQTSGYSGSFHSYLQNTLGAGYDLDETELNDLLNSCTNCNGILKNDIELPLAFEPDAPTCLLCDSVRAALAAFNAKFPGISTTSDNYQLLFANFFNHRFGYSLSYSDYRSYLDSCNAHTLYAVSLCNKPATEETTVDNNNDGCMADLFATALTNATSTYIAYIDSVHRDFREAYLTRCLNVQPRLTMKAELYEYHYTLYYYDQSENLVKTIPPEGVQLLDSTGLANTRLYRLLQNEGCYQYSDSIHFSNNGQINWAVADTFEARPFTAEMMLNADNWNNQVLVSRLSEYTYDTTGGVSFFYKQAGFVAKVESNKLVVELYGIGADTIQRKAVAVSALDVPALLPLHQWTHVVVQRTGDAAVPVQVWVNGNPVALQFTTNDLWAAVTLSGSDSLIVGAHHAAHVAMPGKLQGTIKNLRIYNRLLLPSEIRQNTYNYCQTPASTDGLLFWSAMNNAANNQVRDLITQQNGTLTGFAWQPFAGVYPAHRLPTIYTYNSFNQMLNQYTPDADTSQFFYDRLGRLTASQNKEQKDNASYSGSVNRYSYTRYDVLGRITEVGEKSLPSSDIRNINLLDTNAVNTWMASGVNKQITKNIYDLPIDVSLQSSGASRKRIVASVYLENSSDVEGDSILYSYDIRGNIKTLVQHIKALAAVDIKQGRKQIDYDYDLASGKINMTRYQEGKGDQFFYKYQYDSENQLIRAYSSRDKLIWREEASYIYYLHGPLARTELGHLKVQGVDYAYTLQGWIKGINGDELNAGTEIGRDAQTGSMFSRVSKDVYSLQLGYYSNDFKPIGGSDAAAFRQHIYQAPGTLSATGNQLFNGNISYSTLALSKINNGNTVGYSFGNDQINRMVQMRQHSISGNWSNSGIINAYNESINYDGNGNIVKYLRGGSVAGGVMDSLTYIYNRDVNGKLVNNQLNHIRDSVGDAVYNVDIDNQLSNNYKYDEIGNLISDVNERLDTVRWNVYGKLNRVVKNTATVVNYGYDAEGNRTLKQTITGGIDKNIYYVRDVNGNVLSVYSYSSQDGSPVKWMEQHLYGNKRLGLLQYETPVPDLPPVVINNNPVYDSVLLGNRLYELSNHLGNVHAIISDKKIGHNSNNAVDYYTAEVLDEKDYYPFGMLMPDRQYNVASNSYRYGFNGKEMDNEMYGQGNEYDYGFRIYNPRIGRFLSVDPLERSYPYYTPYQFAGNMPVIAIDLDGMEQYVVTYYKDVNGKLTDIEIRAIYDNHGTILNQRVHQVGSDNKTLVAKGNVLVLEVQKLKNGSTSTKIDESRNKPDSKLTKEETELLSKLKGTKPERETGESQNLGYPNDERLKTKYESRDFDNAATKTYSFTLGLAQPKTNAGDAKKQVDVDKKEPPAPTLLLNNFVWDDDGNVDNSHNTEMYKKIANWLKDNPDYALDIGVTGLDVARKQRGVKLSSWDETLTWHLFSKNWTFGDRTDNVMKQIRDNVRKLGGDVSRLNLHRGNLNAASNDVKVNKAKK